ncbi:MAG TPA: nucleotidyltransferase family protein [Desulfotignum sp.]|nr:nucleotidyltransferase family protein [Desulfotignum sp.]
MPENAGACNKKVAGVILAAGCGSRMGAVKQLLPFENTTILGRVVATARASLLDDIVLVLGSEAGRVRCSLDRTYLDLPQPDMMYPDMTYSDLTYPDMTGIHVVENLDWHKGQAFSVAAGIKALPPETGGALFLLGDQPLVMVQTINRLVSVFQTTDHWIVAPCYNGQRGNPVLVAAPLFDRLIHPAGDAGARVLFDEFRHRMHCLDVDDPGILRDVDTPEDYAALFRNRNSG